MKYAEALKRDWFAKNDFEEECLDDFMELDSMKKFLDEVSPIHSDLDILIPKLNQLCGDDGYELALPVHNYPQAMFFKSVIGNGDSNPVKIEFVKLFDFTGGEIVPYLGIKFGNIYDSASHPVRRMFCRTLNEFLTNGGSEKWLSIINQTIKLPATDNGIITS